ncbi:MAG: sulfotransferase family protein [Acidimicrobiales bacterium]
MALPESSPSLPRLEALNRKARYAWTFTGRRLTADLRPLPDFIILGTQRGGTTSLYRWLASHPDVRPALKKEVHYFDGHYGHGIRWYRAHFPIRRRGSITGESCPYLLIHPLAPARVANDLPHSAKFVVLLREPVERAISHYWLWRQRGQWETEPLERAIALEPERLAKQYERVERGERSVEHIAFSYVSRGEYAPQLRRWFDAVGRDRILVLESEKLYTDPGATGKVLDWLGLSNDVRPFPVANQAPRLHEVSPELVERLRTHFAPHNEELFELLGYQLWTDQEPTVGSTSQPA